MKWNNAIAATWINLEIMTLNKVIKKEKQILYVITYMWNRIWQNEFIYKIEIDSQM